MSATQGYCLVCAKELGIKPVNDIMEKMGITEEQLEAMTESMSSLMNPEDGGFEPGGAVPFPSELLGQFGMNADGDGTIQERGAANGQTENRGAKKENFHKSKRKHIAAYCTDLTMKARRGELDNIIGREREIERVVQILSRRTKNNPCLIGAGRRQDGGRRGPCAAHCGRRGAGEAAQKRGSASGPDGACRGHAVPRPV